MTGLIWFLHVLSNMVSISVSSQYLCTVATYHSDLHLVSPISSLDQCTFILELVCAICPARALFRRWHLIHVYIGALSSSSLC